MAESSRDRRGASKQSKAQTALARLAQLRSKGKGARQADSSEDDEDAPIYDVVDEADYADLVAGRKAAAGGQLLSPKLALILCVQQETCILLRKVHGPGRPADQLAGDFIEDDDGMGYADHGEEDDWSKAELSPEQPAKGKKAGKGKQAASGATALTSMQMYSLTPGAQCVTPPAEQLLSPRV